MTTAPVFRAFWPILDDSLGLEELVAQAAPDLTELSSRAHCAATGAGRWAIIPAGDVPGSGQTTPTVLVYDEVVEPVPPVLVIEPEVDGQRCGNCRGVFQILVDDLLCVRCDSLLFPSNSWQVAS